VAFGISLNPPYPSGHVKPSAMKILSGRVASASILKSGASQRAGAGLTASCAVTVLSVHVLRKPRPAQLVDLKGHSDRGFDLSVTSSESARPNACAVGVLSIRGAVSVRRIRPLMQRQNFNN
jgi:hypothetical protein